MDRDAFMKLAQMAVSDNNSILSYRKVEELLFGEHKEVRLPYYIRQFARVGKIEDV